MRSVSNPFPWYIPQSNKILVPLTVVRRNLLPVTSVVAPKKSMVIIVGFLPVTKQGGKDTTMFGKMENVLWEKVCRRHATYFFFAR